MTTAPTTLDYALAYVARGWPVFPCNKDKTPMTRHGCKNATLDPDLIRAIWAARPNAQIGLATGHAFDVLDVDGYEGLRSLAGMVAKHGCLASSPVSFTPRGGAHFLFLPAGVGSPIGFRTALDWRGDGGYIMAPPSVGRNGVSYTWIIKPSAQPLEPAPAWLVDLLAPRAERRPAAAAPRGCRSGAYGVAALRGEVDKIANAPVGERNKTLFKAACKLGELVAIGMLEVDEVVHELGQAGINVGLTEREIFGRAPKYHGSLRSGLLRGMDNPRQVAS